jgi:hypothetical protein
MAFGSSEGISQAGGLAPAQDLSYAQLVYEIRKITPPQGWFNPKDYSARGDGLTDDTKAVQAAYDAAGAFVVGGGFKGALVYIPAGSYLTTAPINVPPGVSTFGAGDQATRIFCVNTDGFVYGSPLFGRGYGRMVMGGVYLEANSGTDNYGIIAPGSQDPDDEIHGLAFHDVQVRLFETGMSFKTVRNLTISGCQMLDMWRGIELLGETIGAIHIFDNSMVHGTPPSGSGTKAGVLLESRTYTDPDPDQTVSPEGVTIRDNYIYGFNSGVDAVSGNAINILGNDISALVVGIKFNLIQLGLTIADNFIEMNGNGCQSGIYGRGFTGATSLLTQTRIRGNTIWGAGNISASSCVGIRINDDGTIEAGAEFDQDNIVISDNYVRDMVVNDIRLIDPGIITVRDNHCASTTPTVSIFVDVVATSPVRVMYNFCDGEIDTNDTDTTLESVISYHNIVNGSAQKTSNSREWYETGTWTPVDDSGASLTFSAATGTYTRVGNAITARWQITYPATSDSNVNLVGGLPYTVGANQEMRQGWLTYGDRGVYYFILPHTSLNRFSFRNLSGTQVSNATLEQGTYYGTCYYTIN